MQDKMSSLFIFFLILQHTISSVTVTATNKQTLCERKTKSFFLTSWINHSFGSSVDCQLWFSIKKSNIVCSKVCTKREVQHIKDLAGSRMLLSDLPLITLVLERQTPSIALWTKYPEIQVSFEFPSENKTLPLTFPSLFIISGNATLWEFSPVPGTEDLIEVAVKLGTVFPWTWMGCVLNQDVQCYF